MKSSGSEDPGAVSSSLVLIYGDDDFEVKEQCTSVVQAWKEQLSDVEPEYVDGNASTIKEMQQALSSLKVTLDTMSLFGSGKLVWFRNCNFIGSEGRLALSPHTTEAVESLLELLKQCDWQNTRFLISCNGIDKRKRFYKWLKKNAKVLACESLAAQGDQAEAIGIRLIQDHVEAASKTIRPGLAAQLIRWVGLDRRALVSECEKAILHAGEGPEVTIEDVEATATKTRQAKAFAFADAVADRKLDAALVRLDEEIWSMQTDRQKSEMGLLYGLISKFRNMLLVKDLVTQGRLRAERSFASFRSQLASLDKAGFPSDRRFNPMSQNPYVIFRTVSQVGHYRQSELVGALASLMACNTRIISVGDDPSSILRECVIDIILGH